MHASGAREHLARFEHDHSFLGDDHVENARRATIVTAITAATMVVEIVAGWLTGSMALLADGVHMATHAGAIGVAAFAYRIAARRSEDPQLAMGAGKVGDLAGFANAIVLGVVALAIGAESIARILDPQAVAYGEAAVIAVLGLIVNIVCAVLLGGHAGHDHGGGSHAGHSHAGHAHHGHDHAHEHDHGHDHEAHGSKDQNLRGAYLHVLADALTSVLAIAALAAGWAFGWRWVDPAVGMLGAALIASWSLTLMRDTARTLTDAPADPALEAAIRARLELGDVRICDLHLWRVGPGKVAAIVALVTHDPQPPEVYKAKLGGLDALAHVTVEVNRCPGENCAAA
ncbi:MAG: CDF family Co(II)/Ni(II) efflux transporter DmeF [Hansschlegelia sp.]